MLVHDFMKSLIISPAFYSLSMWNWESLLERGPVDSEQDPPLLLHPILVHLKQHKFVLLKLFCETFIFCKLVKVRAQNESTQEYICIYKETSSVPPKV